MKSIVVKDIVQKFKEKVPKLNINKEVDKNKKVVRIVVITIILITLFIGVSLGKYMYNQISKNNMKIANPVLVVETGKNIEINDNNKQGEFEFSIKNYNTNELSDVPLNYTIEIIANEDKEINYLLYKDDTKIETTNNKTAKIPMQNEQKEEHNYKLKVVYEKGKENIKTDLMQDIQIKVHSEQQKLANIGRLNV